MAVGLLWARHRAIALFRRRLRRQGLPKDFVSALTHDYRTAFRFSDVLGNTVGRDASRGAGSKAGASGRM